MLEQLIPNLRERKNVLAMLSYLQGATIAPNMMELAAILRIRDWEAKKAIAFLWKYGLIREVRGEFYHISQLN